MVRPRVFLDVSVDGAVLGRQVNIMSCIWIALTLYRIILELYNDLVPKTVEK